MFIGQQTIILEWFLKDHVTEDWSNDAENSALRTESLEIVPIPSWTIPCIMSLYSSLEGVNNVDCVNSDTECLHSCAWCLIIIWNVANLQLRNNENIYLELCHGNYIYKPLTRHICIQLLWDAFIWCIFEGSILQWPLYPTILCVPFHDSWAKRKYGVWKLQLVVSVCV